MGLDPSEPMSALAEVPVARMLRDDDRFAEADEVLARSLERAERFAAGGDSNPLRDVASELGRLRVAEGRDDEAETRWRGSQPGTTWRSPRSAI
jgi:hypothetical protein